MTKADRIRQMSTREMAEFIREVAVTGGSNITDEFCYTCSKKQGGICHVPEDELCEYTLKDDQYMDWLSMEI